MDYNKPVNESVINIMREFKGERFRRNQRSIPLSPKSALRKILVLAESRQFREASSILSRIAPNAIDLVVGELPVDLLIESLPHSAQLLEILFQKLLLVSNHKVQLEASPILWQIVHLLSVHNHDKVLRNRVFKLGQVLIKWKPDFQQCLIRERQGFDQAIQGLGCHGLIQDEKGLTHLYTALKIELQRHVDAYKQALHRLDELRAKNSLNPTDVSHHRLLSFTYTDIQQRLIDNKTILTILDKPTLKQLQSLIQNLESRVQNDKEALFCVSQLKKYNNRGQPVPENKPVAAILMSFSTGCSVFLDLIQQQESADPYFSEGYHSENDSDLEQRKEILKKYTDLFKNKRLKLLETLETFTELKSAFQLVNKIIFSVIVLAFRNCRNSRNFKLREMIKNLHIEPESKTYPKVVRNFEECLLLTVDGYPLNDIEDQVLDLLCNTLNNYRCLKHVECLRTFIKDSTRICWNLVNLSYEMDTNFVTPCVFDKDKHRTLSLKGDNSDSCVKLYLWPGLSYSAKIVVKAYVEIGVRSSL